ncbi:hypothetical protein CSKR_107202 [Clonorchis sinensis]|uniref:Uncharacterized protein n=1 Tax=Clonorchis sinensis TaxID=79923 RepID=A0A3R7CQA9_CLOSI|nr:hypothetical protein CSKR_107202 [Clonorchis sinensis]
MDRRVTLSESFNGYHPVDPSSHCSHMGRGNRHWVIIEAEDTVQTVISSTNSKHLVSGEKHIDTTRGRLETRAFFVVLMGDLEVPTNNNHTDANKPVPPDAPTNGDTALPHVEFTVLHNRAKHHFSLPPHTTVLELKQALEPLTKVPVSMQKLIHRGLLEDSTQIQSLNLTSREAKLMLVGASQLEADRLRQAEEAASSAVGDVAEQNNQTGDGELSWCEQTEHKRVLERFGKPENAMVGILNSEEMLAPNECLTGLCDKRDLHVRQ